MSLPYENATSGGERAMGEVQKILQRFGCTSFGHMTDFEKGSLLVQFQYRGRSIQVEASMNGYAAAWLKEHPHTYRMKSSKIDHERKANKVASLAVYSILRDWIKGQVTAIDTGILSFEGAFLGQIMLPTGQTVLDYAQSKSSNLLASPEESES